jgi:hypothetical protein
VKVALIYSVNINWSFDLSVFTQNRSEVVLRGGAKGGGEPLQSSGGRQNIESQSANCFRNRQNTNLDRKKRNKIFE